MKRDITQFARDVNNIVYYFRNITVPSSIKDGQSFAFTRGVFSDPTLKIKIGLMIGTAILNKQNKDKYKHLLSISAQIDIYHSKAGPIKINITCSVQVYPQPVWLGMTLVYNKKHVVHGSNVMKIHKGNIVEAKILAGPSGDLPT